MHQCKTELNIFDSLWRQLTDDSTGSILRWGDNDNAKPLHFHPNASISSYDPMDPFTSCIYRTSAADFHSLTTAQIREIFRHRHILVYDHQLDEHWSWSREAMESICPLDVEVECQGNACL